MKYSEEISKKLNRLMAKNYDTEKAYRFAAENVKDGRLQSFFEERAIERYDFEQELRSEIRNYGEMPEEGSSVSGDIHRTWMNLKTNLSANKEEALLEEAISEEKKAVEEYDKLVKHEDMPSSTRDLLEKQRRQIEAALEKVRNLEKQR